MKVIMRVYLEKMPFDKFSDGEGFIHATGCEVLLESGEWVVEYEDRIYADSEDCRYFEECDGETYEKENKA